MLDGGGSYSVSYSYDQLGRLQSTTGPDGNATTYHDDLLGRRMQVDDPSGSTTLGYDTWGNLASLTDAANQRTEFVYDPSGRLTQEIRPMQQATTYEYDTQGRLQNILDAKNQTTEYGYDSQGRIETITYDDGRSVTLSYDANGNLAGYDDGVTSTNYTYDAVGRKLRETVNYGAFSKTFSYSYYANGLKKSFTAPDGTMYEYAYGSNNELREVRIPGLGSITISDYTWNLPKTMLYPGGSKREYEYDTLMRLTRILAKDPGGNTLLDYQYDYDSRGNIVSKTTEHGTYSYGYDGVSRLTSADNPTLADEHYSYDAVGNRTSASNTNGNISHNANNELTVYGGVEYVYDANGNMTEVKLSGQVMFRYHYNADNRLVKVEGGNNNIIAEYYYDPFGRRLWKDVGGTRTYFFYSDEGLVAEYDASGTELRSYGYAPDSTWTTDPLWLKHSSEYYFYQNDHLGTPQKLTAVNGAVLWSAMYTAFGQTTIEIESVTNNLRFPGQYYDAETGWHYNWFRYYEPRIGRYLKIDPIGFTGNDVNWYGYAGNNPINVLDPNGLTHRYDIGTRLDYSCNCGWIDWSHANPGVANGPWFGQLWDGLHGITSNTGWRKSRTGKGFKVTYAQTVNEDFNFEWFGLPLPPIRNVINTVTGGESSGLLVLVHEGTYFVKYNLSFPEQKSVALAIFQEVALHFEQAQSFYPYAWFTDSGYSEEDLPSDLIAFYMAIEGYSPDYIKDKCDVVSPDKAREVWDQVYGRDGGIGQRKNTDIDFRPKDYNESIPCTCPDKMKWPEELDRITPAPKGNLWRDWDYRID